MDWIEVYDMSTQEIADKVNVLERQLADARKQAFEDAVKIVEGIENSYAKNPFPCHPADAVKCVVEALLRGTEKDV